MYGELARLIKIGFWLALGSYLIGSSFFSWFPALFGWGVVVGLMLMGVSIVVVIGLRLNEFVWDHWEGLLGIAFWIGLVVVSALVSDWAEYSDSYEDQPVLGIQDSYEYERHDDYETERNYDFFGDYDCDDFYSWSEAQDFFEQEGGPYDDYHNLDRDGDGTACESLL